MMKLPTLDHVGSLSKYAKLGGSDLSKAIHGKTIILMKNCHPIVLPALADQTESGNKTTRKIKKRQF